MTVVHVALIVVCVAVAVVVRIVLWLSERRSGAVRMGVPAHEQHVSHSYWVHYPEHPARKSDPHYKDFNYYHRQHRANARCYVGERIGFGECRDAQGVQCPPPAEGEQPELELHHDIVEFSLQNGISLKALEVDHPGISDETSIGAWVESDANFRWLCVLPDCPVLTVDGSLRAVQDVTPGSSVIGHDGRPHPVTAVGSRHYAGSVYQWGHCAVTAEHEIMTEREWLAAREVVDEVQVMKAQMLGLGGAEPKILNSVSGAISIDVMDTFLWRQGSTEVTLHNEPMFHHEAVSVPNAHVASGSHLGHSTAPRSPGQKPESGHATAVRAVPTVPVAPQGRKLLSATLAGDVGGSSTPASAGLASQSFRVGRQWDPAVRTRPIFYRGPVFDLSVQGSHSFFAGGIAIHNCAFHQYLFTGSGGGWGGASTTWVAL